MTSSTPRRALSKAYLKAPVSRPEIEQFKAAFVTMQGKIDPDQIEESLVTQMIALKNEGQPTEQLEVEIDVLVYKLYGLRTKRCWWSTRSLG